MAELPVFIWFVLAGLVMVLVTGVLGALAAQARDEIHRHRILVQVKRKQLGQQPEDE